VQRLCSGLCLCTVTSLSYPACNRDMDRPNHCLPSSSWSPSPPLAMVQVHLEPQQGKRIEHVGLRIELLGQSR